jgi:hypothetical protein
METVFSFYSYHRGEVRFKNYQGKQRMREELACAFLDGGKKYNAKKRKLTRKHRRRRKKRRGKRRPPYQHQHLQLALGNKSISYLTGIKKAHISTFM